MPVNTPLVAYLVLNTYYAQCHAHPWGNLHSGHLAPDRGFRHDLCAFPLGKAVLTLP
jgi:hypothetical protein